MRIGKCWNTLLAQGLAGVLSLSGPAAASEDDSMYLQPQRRVEVEPGRRLNLVCRGEGSPTVVFESGLAEPTSTWFKVQPSIAKKTRACSYDRAGSGFSDAPTRAGSSANLVDDLRKLLVAADIAPPYVLVGQSYGGMNVRLYYYLHPDEVVGLVLVDPSHEDQTEGYRLLSPRGFNPEQWAAMREPSFMTRRECVGRAATGFEPGSEWYGKCVFDPPPQLTGALKQAYLDMQQKPAFHLAQLTEEENVFDASVTQLRAERRAFIDLPVIVLTQSPDPKPLRDWETAHLRKARTRMWSNLHQSLADASSRGIHRVVPDSDHSIHLSQPVAVISAIEEILASVSAPHEVPAAATPSK